MKVFCATVAGRFPSANFVFVLQPSRRLLRSSFPCAIRLGGLKFPKEFV
jgi:hypothetical protein